MTSIFTIGSILGTKTNTVATNPTPTSLKPSITFTKASYPRIDGSTATIPLSQAFATKLIGLSKTDVAKFIVHNTTHDAYVNLIDKKADIIFVTEPSLAELKLAKDNNIELEVVPIVKEGFVFLEKLITQ